MKTTSDDPTCATCGRPHGGDYQPRHPFRSEGSALVWEPPKGDVTAKPSRFPIDPVLRQALVDRGVITPQDLKDAEAKIQAVTGVFQDAVRDGAKEEVNDDGAANSGGWGRVRPDATTP